MARTHLVDAWFRWRERKRPLLVCEIVERIGFDPPRVRAITEEGAWYTADPDQVTCRVCRRTPEFHTAIRRKRLRDAPGPQHVLSKRRRKCRGRFGWLKNCKCGPCLRKRANWEATTVPMTTVRVVVMNRTRAARNQPRQEGWTTE